MKNYKMIMVATAVGMAVTAFTSQASITALSGGSLNTYQSISGVTDTPPGGAALATASWNYPVGGLQVDATVKSWVLANNGAIDSPYTGLIFVYQVTTAADNTDPLALLALNGFGNVGPIGAAYFAVSGDVASPQAELTSGGTVNFALNGLTGGQTSDYLYVFTDVTHYAFNQGYIADGSPSTLGQIVAPVPEPATILAGALLLLPLGIGTVRSLRRDRGV